MGIWDKVKRVAGAIPGVADTEREIANGKRADADARRAEVEGLHAANMGRALEIIDSRPILPVAAQLVSPSDVLPDDEEPHGLRGRVETESHYQKAGISEDRWSSAELQQEGSHVRIRATEEKITQDDEGGRRVEKSHYDLTLSAEEAHAILPPLLRGAVPSVPAIAAPEASTIRLQEVVEPIIPSEQVEYVESDGATRPSTSDPDRGELV